MAATLERRIEKLEADPRADVLGAFLYSMPIAELIELSEALKALAAANAEPMPYSATLGFYAQIALTKKIKAGFECRRRVLADGNKGADAQGHLYRGPDEVAL